MEQFLNNVLGPLRNPILVFGIASAALLLNYAKPLAADDATRLQGTFLMGAGVFILFASFTLYAVAFFRLPGTVQEAAFLQNVERTVRDDQRIREGEPHG